jgi:hypothetical protein
MWIWRGLIVLTTLLSSEVLTADSTPEILARNGPWQLIRDDKRCQIFAVFGMGERQVVARFERYVPTDTFVLILTGTQFATHRPNSQINLKFEPALKQKSISSVNVKLGGIPTSIISNFWPNDSKPDEQSKLQPDERAALAHISGLTVSGHKNQNVTLQLDPFDKPMAALGECANEIIRDWGFDPEHLDGLKNPPRPKYNPGQWLIRSAAALDQLQSIWPMEAYFRVAVDKTGSPTRCEIVSYMHKASPGVCEAILKYGHFDPAVDANGESTEGIYFSRARWVP